MQAFDIISVIISSILSLVSFIIAYFQAREKGPAFNNAYIYASKEERGTMDKKPHYKLSRDVFIMLGMIFLLFTLQIVLKLGWVIYINIALMVFMTIYGTVKSIVQSKNSK